MVGQQYGPAAAPARPGRSRPRPAGTRRWRRSGRRRRARTPTRRGRRRRPAPAPPGGPGRRSTGRGGRSCTPGGGRRPGLAEPRRVERQRPEVDLEQRLGSPRAPSTRSSQRRSAPRGRGTPSRSPSRRWSCARTSRTRTPCGRAVVLQGGGHRRSSSLSCRASAPRPGLLDQQPAPDPRGGADLRLVPGQRLGGAAQAERLSPSRAGRRSAGRPPGPGGGRAPAGCGPSSRSARSPTRRAGPSSSRRTAARRGREHHPAVAEQSKAPASPSSRRGGSSLGRRRTTVASSRSARPASRPAGRRAPACGWPRSGPRSLVATAAGSTRPSQSTRSATTSLTARPPGRRLGPAGGSERRKATSAAASIEGGSTSWAVVARTPRVRCSDTPCWAAPEWTTRAAGRGTSPGARSASNSTGLEGGARGRTRWRGSGVSTAGSRTTQCLVPSHLEHEHVVGVVVGGQPAAPGGVR